MSAEKPKKPTAAKKKPAATKHTATKAAATKHTAKKTAATKHTAPKAQLSTSDKVIRFFFGIIVYTALVSGGTYYMQSSLIVLQLLGLYAHWAFILILLPALSGLAQHLIASPARLIVAVLGSMASSAILYPIYADRFWAIPPSITDMIVFTLVIAGIGFTSSINPLDRHVHQRRARRRKKSSEKHDTHLHLEQYGGVVEKLLNSSVLRSIELILTVSSFIGAIWGTLSLGMSAMN
ncbi:MAG: hypothetical protein VYD83_00405 [SAR324 cluster bacterium]|nr:hypothetical protein [SAR324 cluster bacterium]